MDVATFIETLPEDRREDVARLDALIHETLPEAERGMAGGLLGYGPFHYRYESGREGDAYLVAVASRKTAISLYVLSVDGAQYLPERYAERLGQVSVGKSCVRFRHLDDVDLDALRDLLRDAWRYGGAGAN